VEGNRGRSGYLDRSGDEPDFYTTQEMNSPSQFVWRRIRTSPASRAARLRLQAELLQLVFLSGASPARTERTRRAAGADSSAREHRCAPAPGGGLVDEQVREHRVDASRFEGVISAIEGPTSSSASSVKPSAVAARADICRLCSHCQSRKGRRMGIRSEDLERPRTPFTLFQAHQGPSTSRD